MTNVYAAAAALLTAAAAFAAGTGAPFATLLGIASAAAITDAREHRIPNILSLAAAIAAVFTWLGAGAPLIALELGAVAAVSLYTLWQLDQVGGGDVKYLPSLVLAVAALGDPYTAFIRVVFFGVFLYGAAALWPGTSRTGEGPVVVGGALALVMTVGI